MHDAYAWALIRSEHAFRLYTPAEELAISETIRRPMLVGSVLSWVVFAALVALAVRVSAWFCIPAVLVCIGDVHLPWHLLYRADPDAARGM